MAKPILDQPLLDRITAMIRIGAFRRDACLAADIDESSYYKWLSRGNLEIARMQAHDRDEPETREAIYVKFVRSTEAALAEAKVTALAAVRRAANGSVATSARPQVDAEWRAAAWYLEHAFPHEYGKQRLVIEHDGGRLDDEDVAETLAQAAEAMLADERARALGEG